MVGAEADVKMTWKDDIEDKGKRRNMKKQGVMMSRESKKYDEGYSWAIIELVEMKLLQGLHEERMKHLFIKLSVIHSAFPLVGVYI